MADKVQKIREEVERLQSRAEYNFGISLTENERQFWLGESNVLTIIEKYIDSMQKEPKECMYSTANYTNADRLTLCKDCEELCKYNQKTAAESLGISQEAYDEIVDKCLYGSEVELVDDGDLPKEEPVSEDLEEASYRFACKCHPLKTEYSTTSPNPEVIEAFKVGSKWKEQQMMAKAVDGEITFDYYGDDDKTYGCIAHDSFCLEDFGLKDMDKVKIIVIKEN